jgi:hypothetical protein
MDVLSIAVFVFVLAIVLLDIVGPAIKKYVQGTTKDR